VQATLSAEQIEWLKTVDSPTIANIIEVFKVRDRADGYIGGRCPACSRSSARWSATP
jgi:hypothetical protein